MKIKVENSCSKTVAFRFIFSVFEFLLNSESTDLASNNMAAKRKPDLVACTACDMYGTTEQFTDESCDTCKNCERLRCSEGKVRVLEEKIETVRRSFEILEMPKSALESGAGSTDHAGATQRKNGRSQDQPKEEKPVEEEVIANYC